MFLERSLLISAAYFFLFFASAYIALLSIVPLLEKDKQGNSRAASSGYPHIMTLWAAA